MLVELHGGKIHLQSTRGVGTVLRFFIIVERSSNAIPAMAAPPLIEFTPPQNTPVAPGPPTLAAERKGERLRVLIVEVGTCIVA
jgi:hypothetical protein